MQKIPARTTVVNFGVSGLHLIVTVYKAKPQAEINPTNAPKTLPEMESLIIIIQIPIKAITIAISVGRLKSSPRKI